MITSDILRVGSLDQNKWSDITDAITSVNISHTMDIASQVSFTVHDKDLTFTKNNYFQLRRDVQFRGERYEISSVDISSGESGDAAVSVECFPRSVQRMKRDKKPRNYGSTSSYDYVKKIAEEFNLYFVGQQTSKTQSIPQAKNEKTDESVWDVVKRLGDEAEFLCFVVSIPYEASTKKEGILFFLSQKNLLKTWGPTSIDGYVIQNGKRQSRKIYYVPLRFPQRGYEDKFVILELPSMKKSDNDWRVADGSAILWNDPYGNAQMIRPGMTARLMNYAPMFNGYYIITAVEWSESEPGPVRISFRTPEEQTKKAADASKSEAALEIKESEDAAASEKTFATKRRQENKDYLTSQGRTPTAATDEYLEQYVERVKIAAQNARSPYTRWAE